jgi:hypothetical protein
MATDSDTTPLPDPPPAPHAGGGDPSPGEARGPARRARIALPRAWAPSPRLTAALAAAMLAAGIGIGAAIGPAPDSSLAGASRLPLLLSSLIAHSNAAGGTAGAAPAAAASAAAPGPRRRLRHRRAAAAASAGEASTPVSAASPEAASGETTAPSTGGRTPVAARGATLPPVTKVWLIELGGASFQQALATPASAPYIDAQAIPAGSLLAGWSAPQASAFAADAAEIATTEPHLVETVIEPPCPEGPAAAQCAPETPGALSAADTFLEQTVSTITASPAYRTNGLIVVTFAAIAAGAASELPAGSVAATLPSAPAAGALLISPFVTKGARPTTRFAAASPRRSLEALLHR